MKKLICFLLAFTMTGITFVSAEDYPVNIPKLTEAMPAGGFMKPEAHYVEMTDPGSVALFSQEPEKSLEEYLFDEIMNHTEKIDVSMYNFTIDKVNEVFKNMVFSNRYMPITTSYGYNDNEKNIVTYVWPTYIFSDVDKSDEARKRLDSCVNSICEYACTGKTDLEKILFAYEKIVLDFNYDPVKITDPINGKEKFKDISYTPYGFTENNGYAVCQGYSLLFGIILDKLGIENGFCAIDDKTIKLNHIWNYIKVDGNWYHCDSTWGEVQNNDGTPAEGYVSYDHFMRSDGIKDHGDKSKWEVYGISSQPDCSSTEYESEYMFNNHQFPIYRQGDKLLFFDNLYTNQTLVSSTLKNKGPFFSKPIINEDKTGFQLHLLSTYNIDATNIIFGVYKNKTNMTDIVAIPSPIPAYTDCDLSLNNIGILSNPEYSIKFFLTGSDMITPLAECAVIEGSDYN